MKDETPKIGFLKKNKELVNRYLIVLVLIAMVIIMSLLKSEFFTATNLLNIIRSNSPIMIISFGVTMVIISGGIDVSSGSVIALCGVICASLAHPLVDGQPDGPGEYALIVPILASILLGAVCGVLNGLPIA